MTINARKLTVPNPQTMFALSGKAYHTNKKASNIGIKTRLQTNITGKRNQYITKKSSVRTTVQKTANRPFAVEAKGITVLTLVRPFVKEGALPPGNLYILFMVCCPQTQNKITLAANFRIFS